MSGLIFVDAEASALEMITNPRGAKKEDTETDEAFSDVSPKATKQPKGKKPKKRRRIRC